MRTEALQSLTEEEAKALIWDWSVWARPNQLPPPGDWRTWIIMAGRGFGKALDVNTPVPTPDGWSTMGQLRDGDRVFDERGAPCKVLRAHPYLIGRSCYRVKFSDGAEIVADEDHLWMTIDRRTRKAIRRRTGRPSGKPQCQPRHFPSVLTTKDIAATLYDRGEANHCIPCAGHLQCEEAALPIDPYLLGCWLGDGSSRDGSITTADPEIVMAFEAAGYTMRGMSQSGRSTTYGIRLAEIEDRRCVNTGRYKSGSVGFHSDLAALSLLGNKHIPKAYLRSSAAQRMALLQGLLDTDGSCDKITGSIEFCTIKPGLALQTKELAISLGYKAVVYAGRAMLNGRDCGEKYRVCFTAHSDRPLFRLARKAKNQPKRGAQAERAYRRYIVAVEPVASVPVRCITVDSASSLYLAGEAMIATHNTRAGAEWVRSQACGSTPLAPGKVRRIALVAETAADARDVMVKGDSGLLAIHPPDFRPSYVPSTRSLTWPNGCMAITYNAVEPDQLRGPQHDAAWSDELAKWRYSEETFSQLQFGLRLGVAPRQVITTTPRPIPVIRSLMTDAATVVTRGNTFENASNLAPSFLMEMRARYEGTRLGRQELNAEVLEDAPDALWTRANLDQHRRALDKLPKLRRIVVAIDPAAKTNELQEDGAATGIVAAAVGEDGRGYVLEDATIRASPNGWARRAVSVYDRYEADAIVGEVNNGGDMVEATVRSVRGGVPFIPVRASRGKWTRAEPVAAMYEQGRISHVGAFPELEDEMVLFGPNGMAGGASPDRVDALVWALTELFPQLTVREPARDESAPRYRGADSWMS